MEATLKDASGKGAKELENALSSLSMAADKLTDGEGQRLDEDLTEILLTFNTTPGRPSSSEALQAMQEWATIEDTHDIVEALANDKQTVSHRAVERLQEWRGVFRTG